MRGLNFKICQAQQGGGSKRDGMRGREVLLVVVWLGCQRSGGYEVTPEIGKLYYDAETAFRNNQYERARDIYEEIVRALPDFSMGYNNLGNVYAALGMETEAIEALRMANRTAENEEERANALGNIGHVLQAGAQKNYTKIGEAVTYFKRAVEEFETHENSWYNLGLAHDRLGRFVRIKFSLPYDNFKGSKQQKRTMRPLCP